MTEEIITKEKMQALKEISDTNLKVSEAKNLLFKLQETETEYLVIREEKALERIQKVIDDSKEMVQLANENYAQVTALHRDASDLVQSLQKVSETYTKLLEELKERNVEWERNILSQQKDIEEVRKSLQVQRTQIENDNKNIEQTKIALSNAQIKLDSDRGTVERAIERLKNNKI